MRAVMRHHYDGPSRPAAPATKTSVLPSGEIASCCEFPVPPEGGPPPGGQATQQHAGALGGNLGERPVELLALFVDGCTSKGDARQFRDLDGVDRGERAQDSPLLFGQTVVAQRGTEMPHHRFARPQQRHRQRTRKLAHWHPAQLGHEGD